MSKSGDGQVALVTASSAGLGAAVARSLANIGARIVINYCHSREKAEALVSELHLQRKGSIADEEAACKNRYIAIQADLNVRSDIKKLVEETVQAMGRLDIVISNHGWTTFTNFMNIEENIDEEDWDHCFSMNVKSPLLLFHAAKKHLEATEGSFLTVSSVSGIKPGGSCLAYSVTKAAQIHLTKSLALIASPKVRVNTVAPSLMLTEWGMKFPTKMHDAVREKNPLKKIIALEDVAEHIVSVARNRSMTGTTEIVDAGYLLV
ncbi:alcohol dehydrogenase [Cladophialophora psammophila CBS 110553]|uniref:Alcohol dehydrogenase n=1 Tax=Cladophialophora psammophila CBS 110553 TaxID=1182543 RepID=W9WVS3_9EURO|nr:alcohol dehydrogenase [Cladophialophora psammophila CBS 110553]EXJ69165.1 alcohol dehydrogenase [Cladophialophora psammophila CBS 110553]